MKSVTQFLKDSQHRTLNPRFWDLKTKTVKPEIRKRLLKIAEYWREHVGLPKSAVVDVQLIGGNASYFWSDTSDLDLHLIVDFKKVKDCDEELWQDYLRAKKHLWQLRQDVAIYTSKSGLDGAKATDSPVAGRDYKKTEVEMYGEPLKDVENAPKGQGRFSLEKNMWVSEPLKELPKIDDAAVVRKFRYWRDEILDVLDSEEDDLAHIEWLKEHLRKLRQESLRKGGEYSFEALAWKALRKEGLIDKLDTYLRGAVDKSLSLWV